MFKARLGPAVAALAIGAVALAGCTPTMQPPTENQSEKSSASPTPKPSNAPEPSPTATGEVDPDACESYATINFGLSSVRIAGTIVDRGEREFAAGTVQTDDDGTIVSYTVAPGDAPDAIGERLCIETFAGNLALMNHRRDIYADQVLRLPSEVVPWVPYLNPPGASDESLQIPYQDAIEAMGNAADAGDVDAMRAIWNDELKAMFTTSVIVDEIQQALDAGDLTALGHMFS